MKILYFDEIAPNIKENNIKPTWTMLLKKGFDILPPFPNLLIKNPEIKNKISEITPDISSLFFKNLKIKGLLRAKIEYGNKNQHSRFHVVLNAVRLFFFISKKVSNCYENNSNNPIMNIKFENP